MKITDLTPGLQELLEREARKHAGITHDKPIDAEERYFDPSVIKYDSFNEGALSDTAKRIHTQGMISLEEYNRRVKIEQAEAQLNGACCAMRYGLHEVLNGMALTIEEWNILKKEYELSYLRKSDIDTIEGYLSQQTKQ